MLKQTFRHIQGIGEKTERRLWRAGVTCWEYLLDHPTLGSLPPWLQDESCFELERSLIALEKRDAQYFLTKLPHQLHWRLYPEFSERVAYLDIETTGLGAQEAMVTVIGLYDGERPQVYVHGRNLEQFVTDIDAFTLLVTYNGKQFDLPFLRAKLGIPLNQAHIDLRYPLAALGYKGGLKKIEQLMGLERPGLVSRLDGWCAVVLWRYHERGESGALETLLHYNLEDVVHLPALLAEVYNTSIQHLPFSVEPVTLPDPPPIPFQPDESVMLRVLADTGRLPQGDAYHAR